jgi:hypothetical protein
MITCQKLLKILPECNIAVHALQGCWEGKVRIELSVMLHEQTPAIKQILAQLPAWTTSTGFTVFQKSFVF